MDRRERQRAATAAEIRDTARRQLAVSGAAALSLRAVAREMGLTAPALYRYYDDRDALLTALIVDAYRGLNGRLDAARDAQPEGDAPARLAAACLAYRDWAVASPHEFSLVFGSPVPGYQAPAEGPTWEEGARFGASFLELFAATPVDAGAPLPPADHRTPRLDRELSQASVMCAAPLSPGAMQLFVSAWGRLHGLISLEVFGHLGWVGMADPGELFAAEVLALLDATGVEPRPGLLAEVARRSRAAA